MHLSLSHSKNLASNLANIQGFCSFIFFVIPLLPQYASMLKQSFITDNSRHEHKSKRRSISRFKLSHSFHSPYTKPCIYLSILLAKFAHTHLMNWTTNEKKFWESIFANIQGFCSFYFCYPLHTICAQTVPHPKLLAV